MKNSQFLIAAFLIFNFQFSIFNCCSAQSNSSADTTKKQLPVKYGSYWYTSNFISPEDAGKIFQEPFYKKDSAWKYSVKEYLRYSFTYKAISDDSITKRIASIFFSLEQHKEAKETKEVYDFIKTSQNSIGVVSNLENMGGDEAILRIDKLNNVFIMVRKVNKLYKFSTRFVTGKTSNDQYISLIKKIVADH